MSTKKVGIDSDELYPVYFVLTDPSYDDSNYTYDVDIDTLDRWAYAEAKFTEAQNEMSAFVSSKWKNGKRVDR